LSEPKIEDEVGDVVNPFVVASGRSKIVECLLDCLILYIFVVFALLNLEFILEFKSVFWIVQSKTQVSFSE